jgi:hypothetical protein
MENPSFHLFEPYGVMWNLLIGLKPTLCRCANLINLFIFICTQSLIKSIDNEASHIVPFLEEYAECIII